MKKKMIIAIICCVVALLIGLAIGLLKEPKQEQPKTIENPTNITYFTNTEMTEKYTIDIPKEYNDKIFVSLNASNMDTQQYRFKHIETGETLFIVMVYKKGIEPEGEGIVKLEESNTFNYYWWQNDNDKGDKNEFAAIQEYFPAIKGSFKVNTEKKEGE